jgi:dTDP-4-dehydrorhamnose reductase
MILVTGANGMVGSYVQQVFSEEKLLLTDIDTLDIKKYEQVDNYFKKNKPKTVLHLAAETDVDKCEKEIDANYLANALGTMNIALACKKYNALLVYISTGAVFGGEKETAYTEFDNPAPLNEYAKAKYEGEKFVRDLLTDYFIVRAGWMIGGGDKDKKFVGKIVELCQSRPEIKAVDDKFGTITYAKHLLMQIKELLKTEYYGVYHAVSEGVCTRYEIAQEIAKYLKSKAKVFPVDSNCFPLPAPRGRSEAMSSYKLRLLGLHIMPEWRKALAEYLKDWLG